MNIPFFSLKRQWNSIKKEINGAFDSVLETQHYIGGNVVTSFEKEYADYIGAHHAISCNSGTDALWLALKALDLQPNSIVLTTPFSFIASSSEVVAHGADPVFIDIDQTTYNISPQNLRLWLETQTSHKNKKTIHTKTGKPVVGIIAVNAFGLCADFTSLKAIAREWNLWIIEDAAQSIGATHQGQPSGTLGDISCFSFYPTKNLGALGDGGALTTQNEYLAQKLLRLRNHGRSSHYEYEYLGINSRLDALQAAALTVKLRHLSKLNQRRRSIAHMYQEKLSDLSFIQMPHHSDEHVYHQFSCTLDTGTGKDVLRNNFIDHLAQKGIETCIYYPRGLHTIPFLNQDPTLRTSCPHADALTKTIISLPIWPELYDEEVDYIVATIRSFAHQPHVKSYETSHHL